MMQWLVQTDGKVKIVDGFVESDGFLNLSADVTDAALWQRGIALQHSRARQWAHTSVWNRSFNHYVSTHQRYMIPRNMMCSFVSDTVSEWAVSSWHISTFSVLPWCARFG